MQKMKKIIRPFSYDSMIAFLLLLCLIISTATSFEQYRKVSLKNFRFYSNLVYFSSFDLVSHFFL